MSAPPLPVQLAGTGHALPAQDVTSEALDARLGFAPGTLAQVSGVEARRVCQGESQIDLAVAAAKAAMADADIGPGEIDLILGASGVPYQSLPATAPLVMRGLGIAEGAAAAYDINATCLSFVAGLNAAAGQIALGQAQAALVVSSDLASRALPWDEAPEVAALFGDGAGAAVLTRSDRVGAGDRQAMGGAIRACLIRSYPAGYEASSLVAGGTRLDFHADPEGFAAQAVFRMDGPALFRLTHRHFPGFVSTLLDRAGWRAEDVDLVVPHQASPLALDHMIRATGLAPDRVVHVARRLGNQVAASIPVALDMARRAGRASAGTRLLLLGTSAGVSFGGMALEL